MYTYAYLVGTLLPLSLWIVFFAKSKDVRKEMLVIGTNVGFIAILTDFAWFLKDYWYPLKYISVINFIWQEFLYSFILGGLLAVPYEVFFNKANTVSNINAGRLIPMIFLILLPFLIFTNLLKINSIYSSIIGLQMSFALVFFTRKDLRVNSLVSGLLAFLVALVGYTVFLKVYPDIISDWWMLQNLSGIFVGKIPIEELIWFTSFGMVAGTIYKFCHEK